MTYYQLTAEELGTDAKIPLIKLGESREVFYDMAMEMLNEIKANNAIGKTTVFICPVGPVGQYSIFTRFVNSERVSLKNCVFINMDEYLDDDGNYIDINSKLSFRGFMNREVYSKIDADLLMPEENRVFPDPQNPDRVLEIIEKFGGVDIAFGGIGINGHLAFNEPQNISVDDFANLTTHKLEISPETRTINSVGDLNGAIEAMPKYCVTVGMKEILSARKIRLGVFRDWHRAVVRRAAYGDISADFPVTICQSHPDVRIYLNSNSALQPF